MRRWWPFGKKKGSGTPTIGAPSNVSLNGGDMMTELAKQGFHPIPIASPQITGDAPAQAAPSSGVAAAKPAEAKSEIGKPVAAVSAVNIDPDEALAASGQLLIEQKLSKAEAM